MPDRVILFTAVYLFFILERIVELVRAKGNQKWAISQGAREFDSSGYRWIVIMHTAFLILLPVEFFYLSKSPPFWFPVLFLLLSTELFRIWILISLGRFWNTKIIVIPKSQPIRRGPYRFLKHPNYIVVVLEIFLLPLLFGCYFTLGLFSALNLFALNRRITLEENAWKEMAITLD